MYDYDGIIYPGFLFIVQCYMMKEDGSRRFDPRPCDQTPVYVNGEAMCRCNRTGYVVAALERSLLPIVTTESPFVGT